MKTFGKALIAYSEGDKTPFYFKDTDGKLYQHDLSRYFRKTDQLMKIENELISRTSGRILDVGCATGYYIRELMKHGSVTGIDISEGAIAIAHKNGLKDCKVADIFSFQPKITFNTITIFENTIGMGGTVARTAILLKKLSELLDDNGEILAIIKNFNNIDYVEVELTSFWKGQEHEKMKWIHLNIHFLVDLCRKAGLSLTRIKSNRYYHLVSLRKK